MNKLLTTAACNLAGWFNRHQRTLPWRDNPDPYRVWVSEIMLQQTTVTAVIPYFERFTAVFPTVEKLAASPLEDVLAQWAGLGYYSRARNLHRAAQMIATSGFPQTRAEWLELPGVGEYTAGAVCSIALNQPEAILDANVKRVLARFCLISDPETNKQQLWDISREFVVLSHTAGFEPRIINQALMELGALTCRVTDPLCGGCPLHDGCQALKNGNPQNIAGKRARIYHEITETAFAIVSGESILMHNDPQARWRKGFYDLPARWPLKTAKPAAASKTLISYTVTNHKVTRRIEIYPLSQKPEITGTEWSWVDRRTIETRQVAVSAPGVKSFETVLKHHR